MSLEALEQAVEAAKWGDAPADAIGAIAETLELSRAVVERVLFARSAVMGTKGFTQLRGDMDDGETLPDNVRSAITYSVRLNMRRAAVRHAMRDGDPLYVAPSKLVKKPADICRGCPLRMQCVFESATTPERCVEGGVLEKIEHDRHGILRDLRRYCLVTPTILRGDKVTFTCDHPVGTWTLDVMDLDMQI